MVLQLVQTNHCGNDEYYIQRMENGQYLKIDSHRRPLGPVTSGGSVCIRICLFQDCQSEATLFRFKKYQRPLEEWRRCLGVGSSILYKLKYPLRRSSVWVKGEVIGTKDGEFGREIMAKYKGITWGPRGPPFSPYYTFRSLINDAPKVERVSGEIWIPIESNLISNKIPYGVLKEEDFSADDFKTVEERERDRKAAEMGIQRLKEAALKPKGIVKRYDAQKGYGFIACDDGSGDLFVHFSEIKRREVQILREGERVAFDVVIQADGRRKATNVWMIGYGAASRPITNRF